MRSVLSLCFALVLAGCSSSEPEPKGSPPMEVPAYRTFGIEYVAKLDGLETGAPLRAWIPVPSSGDNQTVSEVSVSVSETGLSHRFSEDPVWGNRILYLEGSAPAAAVEVTLSYVVRRFERRADLAKVPQNEISAAERERGLAPGRLVVIDERIRNEAKALSGDDPQSIAQAAYDHVALQMVYDKSGEGWGRGDSLYACEVGKGNCTDYHAYFMALCAARQIPTRFEIGLFGPYEPRPGETLDLGGYHCWAEFFAGEWIPVDISEGDKKEVSFFGHQTPNRVTLSRGRDLVLEPAQAGEPLNYFVNPYAEVGGKPHPGVSKSATWTDEAPAGR